MSVRRAGMPRTRSRARLLAGCAAVALGMLLGVVAAVAPAAGAAFAQIRGELGCDRVVHWSAAASPEGTASERTHASVQVDRRYDGGAWEPVGPTVAFGPDNDHTASGSFELADDATSVALRVRPIGPWASGDPAGEERFTDVQLPRACASAPIAVSHRFDCDVSALVVSARSLATTELPLQVRVDDATAYSSSLPPGAATEVAIPLVAGATAGIAVDSGEVRLVDRRFTSTCTADRTTVAVLRHCTPTSGVLNVRGGPASTRIDLLAEGGLTLREDLAAGAELRHVFSVSDPSAPIEVLVDGRTAARGPLGDCAGTDAGVLQCADDSTAPCATAAPVADGPMPGTGTASGQLLDEGGAATLPTTGPLQRAVLLLAAAALLVGGGISVVASDRSIREVSLLQQSVDQYRQRWWSEGSPPRRK